MSTGGSTLSHRNSNECSVRTPGHGADSEAAPILPLYSEVLRAGSIEGELESAVPGAPGFRESHRPLRVTVGCWMF